jgi:hypothetical protein
MLLSSGTSGNAAASGDRQAAGNSSGSSRAALSSVSTAATPTPTPVPTGTRACSTDTVYGDFVSVEPIAVVPGAAVENGIRIHNRAGDSTAGASFNVAVVTLVDSSSAEGAPTVEWDVDGGPWHSVGLVYVPKSGSIPASWDSADMPAPTIPAYGSRLFRMRIAFSASTVPGHYDGYFQFVLPGCAPLVSYCGALDFIYAPDMAPARPAAPLTAAPALKAPSVAGGGPSAVVTTSPPAVSGSAGSTTAPTMSTTTGTATPSPAAVSTAGRSHPDLLRLAAGMVVASLCGVLVIVQIIRRRRLMRPSR